MRIDTAPKQTRNSRIRAKGPTNRDTKTKEKGCCSKINPKKRTKRENSPTPEQTPEIVRDIPGITITTQAVDNPDPSLDKPARLLLSPYFHFITFFTLTLIS